ncbi:MAG: hypothetical protein AAFR98_01290, partial [Pseudomonadota bacterium]
DKISEFYVIDTIVRCSFARAYPQQRPLENNDVGEWEELFEDKPPIFRKSLSSVGALHFFAGRKDN